MKFVCYEIPKDVDYIELKNVNKTAFICTDCSDHCVVLGAVELPSMCPIGLDAEFEQIDFADVIEILYENR
jgi:hypothetical protein